MTVDTAAVPLVNPAIAAIATAVAALTGGGFLLLRRQHTQNV
ncbi:hypothetical protein [Rhodococcus sp. ACT016]